MIRYLGVILKRFRKEKGQTQKEFAKNLGDHGMAARTLQRIESGDKVDIPIINELIDHLDIELSYILRDEYETKIVEELLEDKTITIMECIKEMNFRIEEYRFLNPPKIKGNRNYHITNLAEFLIYLPLMDDIMIYDVTYRIGGIFEGRATYVLNMLDVLYRDIPDSVAKEVADELVMRLRKPDYVVESERLEIYNRVVEKRKCERKDVNMIFENVYAWLKKREQLGELIGFDQRR